MGKMFKLLVVLVLIYAIISIALNYFSKGKTTNYIINDYNIKEIYTNYDIEKDNYYFDISFKNKNYNLKIYNEFKGKSQVIKSINYVEGNTYTCIRPVFIDNKTYNDYRCEYNGVIYNYADLYGRDSILDNKLLNLGYTLEDENKNSKKHGFISAFPDNLEKNHLLLISNYKGYCILLNERISKFGCTKLFNNDAYIQNIRSFTKNYYVVADYNQQYEFNKLYYYNLKTSDKGQITLDNKISFNSFIQGYNDNLLYIIDKDNKTQYEINLDYKNYKKICDANSTCKNLNGEDKTIYELIDAKYSDNFVTTYGNDKIGYTYEKNNNEYYKIDHQNMNIKSYAFNTNRPFVMADEFVYYVDSNSIYLYGPNQRKRIILTSKELIENNNLYFNVYVR